MNQWNKPPLGSQIDPEHPLARGLVACWLMNEGSGNRIQDLTGNGNHGTLTNGPLWNPGQRGAAVSLDGNNDFVSCGSVFRQPQCEISVFGRIYYRSFTSPAGQYSRDALYCDWRFEIGNQKGFQLSAVHSNADVNWFQMVVGDGVDYGYGATYPGLDNASFAAMYGNRWIDIAGVFQSGKIPALYMNGTRVQTTQGGVLAARMVPQTFGPGLIGRSNVNTAYANAVVSHVSIYSRALSPQEILDLYINPYAFIHQPRQYWLMPQGGMIPPHLLHRRAA